MHYRETIDEIYNKVVEPLENFSSNYNKGNVLRMIDFMKVFGDVMEDYYIKTDVAKNSLSNLYPNQRDEIDEYILEIKNRIVETYKPK